MLSVDRVRPAYQQVADQLLARVLDGSLAAGDRLPAEGELAVAFGVSRSTVREAFRVLASRDLITTVRGTVWRLVRLARGCRPGQRLSSRPASG